MSNISKIIPGNHGNIHVLSDNVCEKIYSEDALNSFRERVFDINVFNTIKRLYFNNLGTLIDFNYSEVRRQILSYKMTYYQNKNIDILEMPISYTLDNLYRLYIDMLALAVNKILANDMHSGNAIFTNDKIIIVDLDNLKKLKQLKLEELINLNINEMCYLFRSIYKEALYQRLKKEYIPFCMDRAIGLFSAEKNENIVSSVSRKLKPYSYPIDYFILKR